MTDMFEMAFEAVQRLADDFRANERFYLSSGYQEQEARKDFIDKFLTALGWDVNHVYQKNPYEQEVKVERGVRDKLSNRRADYAFYLAPNFRDVCFYVEAKKPARQIDNADDYFQAIRYGWNSGTPLVVLTDFEQFRALDCRYKPDIGTALERGIKQLFFHYSDYDNSDRFAEIYWLFSREAVAAGSLAKYAAALPKRRGKGKQRGLFKGAQAIDEAFLEDLDSYRETLAKGFKKHNSNLDGATLTEITQRTLDRLVFMRFLEDKLIEMNVRVADFGNGGSSWRDFVAASVKLDGVYNGIVFKRHRLLDAPGFEADEDAFSDICDDLAHDRSPYDFDLFPIHILGSIYERFLGKIIVATDKRARVEEKPEVRKAGGVYYTPEYIVRYIVEQTVGRLIQGKTPTQITAMRFADIASGSGSFLLGVFDCLQRYHCEWYSKHTGKAKKGEWIDTGDGTFRLSLAKKREILTNNIYGVDIDAQAVEVAQISLYLKLLEEETAGSARTHQMEIREALLPPLNKNIVCGNSLVDWDILDGQLFPPEEERKLNPMSFESAFPEIMKHGGFDAIVGNPPYLSVDDVWGKNDIRLSYLKATFPLVYSDKTDILFYFLARAAALSKGYVGMIVSRAFLEAFKAQKLRSHLLHVMPPELVLDFRNATIFPGVGITTCVIVLSRNGSISQVESYQLLSSEISGDLMQMLGNIEKFERNRVSTASLSSDAWVFANQSRMSVINRIDSKGEPLGSILHVGQGMQTGKNDVFGKRTLSEIRAFGLRKGQYFQRAVNSSIDAFSIQSSQEYIIYTEAFRNWNEVPSALQSYLVTHKSVLQSRAAYKRGNCEWWRFTWPLHADWYGGIKLLCPYLAQYNRFAIDPTNAYLGLTDTTVLFPRDQSEHLLYFLGLLNSKLLTFRFRFIGKLKSGGIYEYFWNSISKLPIRRIDFNSKRDDESHAQLVKLVSQMLKAKLTDSNAVTERDLNYYERRCKDLDRQIDALVYQLYGLIAEEIQVVEDYVAQAYRPEHKRHRTLV